MRRLISLVAVLPLVLALVPTLAGAQTSDASLAGFLSLSGVSGFEADVRTAIRAGLPAHVESRVDEIGNLVVTFGRGKPHLLICANIDEDGFFVSAITEEGYLRVHRVTSGVTNRLFEQMHYGQPMWIRTQGGKRVPGVFVTASSHLQRGRDTSAAAPKTIDDLWIDVGAQSRAEVDKLGVQVLDPVSLRERSQELAGGRVAGANAQGRAAAYALRVATGALAVSTASKPLNGAVTIAFTVQGSFGERGMARLAQAFPDVDRVIVVARTAMPRDGSNAKGGVGQLGGGVIVAEADAQTLADAKQHQVAVQPLSGVVRAPAVWPAAKTRVVSLPVQFAQTPVEVVDTSDVAALSKLLLGAATAGVGGGGIGAVGGSGGIGGAEGKGGARVASEGRGLVGVLGVLVGMPAVSGAEGPVRDFITGALPKWAKPEIDERGNVTVSFGKGGRELVFVSHMDEIGYEITGVLEDGSATVRKRGGFFDYLWEAHPVLVQTAKGTVKAVVAPRPGYLRSAEAAPKPEEVLLYFGTASRGETEALGVAKGNTATIGKQLTALAGSRYTARSMDDRCGVAAMLEALRAIDPAKVPNRVTFAFVVGEETGLEGSGFLAQRAHPSAVFAIDTFVSSDSPVDPQRMALVPLGSGVVARAIDSSSITPPDTVARVVSIGRAHKVPVTPSTTSGGNDGSQFSRYGSIVVPLSWPGRYSHSPVEVMDLRDLNNLTALIAALVSEF